MLATQPRITARVDEETKALLTEAAKLSGNSSINSFVLSAAVEKAKKIISEEKFLRLSIKDSELFLKALDNEEENPRLKKAYKKYADR